MIVLSTFAVIGLHKAGLVQWLVYVFAAYMLLKFYYHNQFKSSELF